MGKRSKPSLKINAISNWTALVVNVAIQFFMTPFIIRHLGAVGYGIWTLAWSFVGYYGLLDLGVGSAMTRYVARYASQGDEKSLNETVSTAMTMFCIVGAVIISVSLFAAAPLAVFFKVDPEHFVSFKRTFQIIGLAIGFSFPITVFSGTVRAHERFVIQNVVSITILLVQTGLTIFLLLRGYGLLGAASAILAAKIINMPTSILVCKFLMPSVRVRFAFARMRVLRMLMTYGAVTMVIVIADLLRINMDSVVIGRFIGLSMVGVYGIAASIIRYTLTFISAGMGVLSPRFASLDGKGDHEQVRRLLTKSMSISSFMSFGAYMMAIIFGKQFLLWYLGPDVAARFMPAVAIIWILSSSYAFAIAQNPCIGLMYALNKHRYYAVATMAEAIANVVLSIILVFKYGIVGVALGTMIPMLIIKILIMPVYMSKILKISIWQYIRPMVPPLIIASVMVLTAHKTGIITGNTATLGYLLCYGAIAGGIYITAYYLVMCKYDPSFITSLIPAFKVTRKAVSTTD